MWYEGFLQPTIGELVLWTLALTHVTIVGVTVYLHRHSAHRALDVHPALGHFFRFWLWLTTGMGTKEWTAVHRKHHAKCETPEDPHSPVQRGLRKVLLEGAELYREGITPEVLEKYGKGTPDDWIERHLYTPHSQLGIGVMLAADVLLFGAAGITVWAIQMLWIPLFAAGVINGVCHHTGYRNFESPDAATNIVPWGILIGGEELHNNHHTFPSSAKLSARWWEFDIGWMWIRLFEMLGLARVKRLPPKLRRVPGKVEVDLETTKAVLQGRFQVMAQYVRTVMWPVAETELSKGGAFSRRMIARAKKLLAREQTLLDERSLELRERIVGESQVLRVIEERRRELQTLWENRTASIEELRQLLNEWCQKAESSGIQSLRDFAASLRTYTLAPGPA